jgi:hypothetical protein
VVIKKKQVRLNTIETARLIFAQIFPFLRVSLPKILFSNTLTGIFNIIAIKIPIKSGEISFNISDSTDIVFSILFIIPNSNIETTKIPSHFR